MNPPKKTDAVATKKADAALMTKDQWMAQPIRDTNALVEAIKAVELGLAQVSGGDVDGPRVARMVHLCKLAIMKNPAILECTRGSLTWALLDAARVGLEPDGEMGALVPYKSELRFQPMYRGLIHLAAEAGICHDVDAVAVFKGDAFRVSLGTSRLVEHEPDLFVPRTWGSMVACYAVFRLRDGSVKFDVMTKSEIESRRAMSRAKTGPWDSWPIEMAKKTVIKHGLKLLPRVSVQLREAVDIDNRADQGQAYLMSEDERVQVPGLRATAATQRGNAALAARIGVTEPAPPPAKTKTTAPPADDGEELGAPAPPKPAAGVEERPDRLAAAAQASEAGPPPVLEEDQPIEMSGEAGPAEAEITDEQRTRIGNLCDKAGGDAHTSAGRLRLVGTVLGRELSALGALTFAEAQQAIDALSGKPAAVPK